MRKSRVEVTATEKAVALLNDSKVKLVGYRTQLIIALLTHERQRKELAEAREQRKHELRVLKLKAELARTPEGSDPTDPSNPGAVAAAREFLARINGGEKRQ
jgi:hypothetical protein